MNNIRKIASEKQIKISQLIKATGLSKSFVYDIINNKSQPTISVAYKICDSLNATIDEVFPHN